VSTVCRELSTAACAAVKPPRAVALVTLTFASADAACARADGIASKLAVHPGSLVNIGMPVVQIVPRKTYVVANFKETQMRSMRPGQRASVKIDAIKGKEFEGRVESMSGGTGASFSILPPDNASGNFVKVVQRVPVRISWNGPDATQAPVGSSAEVTVYSK